MIQAHQFWTPRRDRLIWSGTAREVATKLGTTIESVYGRRTKLRTRGKAKPIPGYGKEYVQTGTPTATWIGRARKLRAQGMTYAAIAQVVGVTRQRVHQALR